MSAPSALLVPLLTWYDEHARDLPWREPSASPWAVMVSEFMLQQTPVARVLPVWAEWMSRWPEPADLAAEPAGAAVRAWGRLGYPRRALRLHAAATAIVDAHSGTVPSSYDALLALPGVGDYTAAAVASFAYRRRHVVLDTNVRRVLARAVSGVEFPPSSVTHAERDLAWSTEGFVRGLRADGRHLGGGHHGAGRDGLRRRRATMCRVPGHRAVRVAGERVSRSRRPAATRPDLRRHRPPVPWPVAGRAPR